MKPCEVCGNEYDKSFEVTMNGTSHVFDSFECAIHALAPTCGHERLAPDASETQRILLNHQRTEPLRDFRVS